ncbi:hypothetical protein GGI22_004920, partial [Coemansia erecta]
TTDVDARAPSSRAKGRSLEISLIDDSATSDNDGPSRQNTSRNKRRRTEVIDLTLDSDSENDVCSLDYDDLPPMTQEEIDLINAIDTTIDTTIDASTQSTKSSGSSGQASRSANVPQGFTSKRISNYEKTPAY